MIWPFTRHKKSVKKAVKEETNLPNGKEELKAAFAAARNATAEFRRETAAFQLTAEQARKLAEMCAAKRAT